MPENPGGAGALLEGGRSARISVAAHIPFHGLIEFVGSHANFALIAVFLLALSREVMTEKEPGPLRCFESHLKLLSDRCLGFDIKLRCLRSIAAKDAG